VDSHPLSLYSDNPLLPGDFPDPGRTRGGAKFSVMEKSFIWFDLGYTLLYLNREEPFLQTLREFDLDADPHEVERVFHLADKTFMREYPGLFGEDRRHYMPWYFGVIQYHLGLRFDLCRFFQRWQQLVGTQTDSWFPYPFTVDVLEDLNEKGYRMGVISNWDKSARKILKKHRLDRFFEHIIISSEVGSEKPDVRIFQKAMQAASVDPGECIYVGDNYYDDAVGSRKVGMETIIINRYGELGIEELENCSVICDIRELDEILNGRG
jgi:putative hydrolase of the HAD superfamily